MIITTGYFSKGQQQDLDDAMLMIDDAIKLDAPESKDLAATASYERSAVAGEHLPNWFNKAADVPEERRVEIDIECRQSAAERIVTTLRSKAESILSGNHSGPKTKTKFGDFDFK